MSTKAPNLATIGLAGAAGSIRHRAPVEAPAALSPAKAAVKGSLSRDKTKPITFHFPKEVRDQLKILAVEQGKTMHQLGAEAMNDLFAKFGKPEIAPSMPAGE